MQGAKSNINDNILGHVSIFWKLNLSLLIWFNHFTFFLNGFDCPFTEFANSFLHLLHFKECPKISIKPMQTIHDYCWILLTLRNYLSWNISFFRKSYYKVVSFNLYKFRIDPGLSVEFDLLFLLVGCCATYEQNYPC